MKAHSRKRRRRFRRDATVLIPAAIIRAIDLAIGGIPELDGAIPPEIDVTFDGQNYNVQFSIPYSQERG